MSTIQAFFFIGIFKNFISNNNCRLLTINIVSFIFFYYRESKHNSYMIYIIRNPILWLGISAYGGGVFVSLFFERRCSPDYFFRNVNKMHLTFRCYCFCSSNVPTLYSLLRLVNKSINIWPFSYWPCYMLLVLIMASVLNFWGIRYRVCDIGYKRYRLGTIIDNAYTKHLYFYLNIWYRV
jgi:hypothetical protein